VDIAPRVWQVTILAILAIKRFEVFAAVKVDIVVLQFTKPPVSVGPITVAERSKA
jgi:hypothetical protein